MRWRLCRFQCSAWYGMNASQAGVQLFCHGILLMPVPSKPSLLSCAAVVEAAVAVAPRDQPLLRRLLGTLGVPQKAARHLDTLVLRRELSKGPDGVRSKCFVNGSTTSGAHG